MIVTLFMLSQLAQVRHPCQPCHAKIVATYNNTAMAKTSGRVDLESLMAGQSLHDTVTNSTFTTTPALELHYSKGEEVRGKIRLDWFIGSGRVGRSYLFHHENRLFQAPVSFYSKTGSLQLSPGFGRKSNLDLTRAVEPSCLNCHTSRFNPATLAIVPGIGCERCHGDGAQHIASGGRRAIVNPGKLSAHERDSVCAQCHLTGVARVARFRQDGETYKPGMKLSDYSAIFVGGASVSQDGLGVTSHFEKLQLSRCAIASGEKLHCATCHDPHSEPADASTHFNPKCQSCHQQKVCTKAPQGDCIQCHMPKASGRGVDHSSYTDHSIPRDRKTREDRGSELRSFWNITDNGRDIALALSILGRFDQAQPLLEAAIAQNKSDVSALSQLAQIHERKGREELAQPLYEAILKLDPNHSTAATNLAVIRIKSGRVDEAIQLWRTALKSNPAQTGVRMNLAQALFRQGRRAEAALEVEQALRFDPDQLNARRMLKQLRP